MEQEGVATQTDTTSASMDDPREELDRCHQVIEDPTARLTQRVATLSEASLEKDVLYWSAKPKGAESSICVCSEVYPILQAVQHQAVQFSGIYGHNGKA